MRKFSVEIPNVSYWRKQINCQDACPVHTDARGYVRAIAAANYELAARILINVAQTYSGEEIT